MDNKTIIGAIIVIVIVIIVGAVVFMSNDETTSNAIEVKSNSTLSNGENFTVQVFGQDGKPLANKQIDVTLVAVNGDKNTLNLITNSEGIATFQLNGVGEGNYVVQGGFPGCDFSTDLVVNDTA